MLSTMREKTKVVMLILLVAFVGWLIFDVGMGLGGQGQTGPQDVGSVNGKPIRYQQWMEAYRVMSEQARAQNPGATFTREEQLELETQAFEGLVQAELLREEYKRRGITVSDEEIVDLVRRVPPPEIQQSPDFQTDGRFDPAKYERFIASNNEQAEQYRLTMEARYRDELPRYKLLQSVTSDVFISDARLWQLWRDTHESLSVKALVIRPQDVPDSLGRVTDEEARRYYNEHREEIRRPARAVLSFVALSKLPTTVDSAQLNARVLALRDSIVRNQISFDSAAKYVSTDSSSNLNGGLLGTFARGAMAPPFDRAVFSLPIGRVSDPVYTSFGVHLIKVERRTGDSATARHILLPYGRSGARLDTLEARADSLDRIGGEQDDGSLLDTAAARLRLVVERGPPLFEGIPYVLGRYRIPDVSVWAFNEARVGQTSPVVETNGFYYVFRLDSLRQAGLPPFDEVAAESRAAASLDKKKQAAARLAERADSLLTAGRSMEDVAREVGGTVETLGPFVRTSTVPVLGTATPAIGTAFRLRAGERSSLLRNNEAFFFIQPQRRTDPDSAAWAAQKEEQRAQMLQVVRRARAQMYVDALRRAADVKDRRLEIMRANAEAAANAPQLPQQRVN